MEWSYSRRNWEFIQREKQGENSYILRNRTYITETSPEGIFQKIMEIAALLDTNST